MHTDPIPFGPFAGLRGDAANPVAVSAEGAGVKGQLTPLCVDLDGTLVKSDTLLDSVALLLRKDPLALLSFPAWVLQGKAGFKSQVSARAVPDPAFLPYNRPLLQFLTSERDSGRKIYLSTGADREFAERVADHLGLFAGVFASDGSINMTGIAKRERLRQEFGSRGYSYIGNGAVDAELMEDASTAMMANPDRGLRRLVRSRGIAIDRQFLDRAPRVQVLLSAIRIHQWAKNSLIFLPILLAHVFRAPVLARTALAFLSFSFCASSTYLANDILDIESDRRHRVKRLRPFAAGEMSVFSGIALSLLLCAAGMSLALVALPRAFTGWLVVYIVSAAAYLLRFKRVVLLDVILLSGLYILRLLAGAAAAPVPISAWLAAFSLFLFLSLAIAKRFSELETLHANGESVANGRGYLVDDLTQLRASGTAAAFAALVVFSIYIGAPDTARLYHHPARLWLMMPLLVYWLSRVWLLASRGSLNEDPVIFALTDRSSLLVGAAMVLICGLAAAA